VVMRLAVAATGADAMLGIVVLSLTKQQKACSWLMPEHSVCGRSMVDLVLGVA
jgi:hypothetical protein